MSVARLARIGSPYNGSELSEIDFEQSADTMYIAHIDHAPTKLLRYAHDSWEFMAIAFGPTLTVPTGLTATPSTPNTDSENDGNGYFPQPAKYVVTAINDETGQESRASNSDDATNDLTLKRNYNTISWTGYTDADRYRVFKSDNQLDYGYIGTTEVTTFRDDNIGPDLSDGPPLGKNPFDGAGNYPSTVTFFEQRLWWGRTKNRPNAIWGSKSGDYENLDVSRPLKDDDALSLGLVAGRVNAVNQLVSITDLLALTSDSLFKIEGANDQGFISAKTPVARRQVGRGSSRLSPLVIDNIVFYRPSTGSAVRSIGYSFELDGIKTDDISIFSPHLFDGFEIVSWAYAQEPRSLIWAVRSDGKLLCFTWEQEQQVWGWTLCETDGLVESVCVISENGEDRLYLTVRRTVESVERVFIEELDVARWDAIEDACYLDCAGSFVFDTPQTLIHNLDHLEGRKVDILADGHVVLSRTVENGRVTIPNAATKVCVGLPYVSTIKTMPLAMQTREGTNIGKRQMSGKAVLRLVNTRGIAAGPTEASLYAIKPRFEETYDEPAALLNGLYPIEMAPVVQDETSIMVRQTYPLPMTVTAAYLDPVQTE